MAAAAPPKREKKPLVITDKNGNVLDFRSESAQKKSSLKAAVAAGSAADDKDAGSKLKEAALARIKGKEEADEDSTPEIATKHEKTAEDPSNMKEKAESPVLAPEPAKPSLPSPATKMGPGKLVEAPDQASARAKEESKEETPKTVGKTLADVAAAPTPSSAEPALKSVGSSLAAAASKKPNMAAVAAAPAPPVNPKPSSGGLRPGGKTRTAPALSSKGRIVYDKTALMRFKTLETCMKRPDSLPDMTIVKGPAKQQGGGGGGRQRGGGGGGGDWNQRGPRRRDSQNNGGGGNWSRGQEPPRDKRQGGRGGNRRDSNHNNRNGNQPEYTGPVAPLKKTANGWKPTKNNNPLELARKQVNGILNKMTKEKFETLSAQMCAIQILSYDMLTMMIHNVYEKAIDEPSFGDTYADLCVRLSKGAAQANNDFVRVIESDEEPPTEGEAAPVSQSSSVSSHIVYRWSNDVNTDDDDVVGPLKDAGACIESALNDTHEPTARGDVKLQLVKLVIKNGIFIKVMRKKDTGPNEVNSFYTVYFKVEEAKECGQQLSEIFLSEVECVSNAKKKNSFKRSLLNKCEDEFKKQDIYVDWKKEMKEYEEGKSGLTPAERSENEKELMFRRMKIKKQMLGNIKFIGQLYKKGLLKEKIMRYCIGSLLKLEELTNLKSKNPEYKDTGDTDMDEEDHEAICSMFTTIGSTIDTSPAADFMKVCFTKIKKLSLDKKNLPARSRFMYTDLLELRENSWVPRRDEGKAKTLDEIKKDFEREEKKQAQQSAQVYSNDRRGGRGGQQGYSDNRRGSNYGGRGGSGNRNRPSTKPQQETDDDGFTVIARGAKGHFAGAGAGGSTGGQRNNQAKMSKSSSKSNISTLQDKKAVSPASNTPAALTPEKLERRIKSMRAEYMQDPSNLKELLLSMDELSGTKDSGFTLVVKSADALLDCKTEERKAITDIIRILYEKGKLSQDNIRTALADFIEFIDSMIMDCPKLFEYTGDLLAMLFVKGAIDIQWYCVTVEKTKMDPEAKAPEMLTRATISSIRSQQGVGSAEDIFGKHSALLNKLCGADQWNSISKDLLG